MRAKRKEMKAAEKKKFAKLVREHLASLGAVREDTASAWSHYDPRRFLLATKGGTLKVRVPDVDEATVFCQFENPQLAALVVGRDFNPYSGKWNFLLDDCETAADALAYFANNLSLIVVPSNAGAAKAANERVEAWHKAAKKEREHQQAWKFEGSTGLLTWAWNEGRVGLSCPCSTADHYMVVHRSEDRHELEFEPSGQKRRAVGVYKSAVLARLGAEADLVSGAGWVDPMTTEAK